MSPPDLFTVNETAIVLRIGRTTAYELARRDLESSGGEGLGVVRIGGPLRVPRASLERVTGWPLSWPPCPGTVDAKPALTEAVASAAAAGARRPAGDSHPILSGATAVLARWSISAAAARGAVRRSLFVWPGVALPDVVKRWHRLMGVDRASRWEAWSEPLAGEHLHRLRGGSLKPERAPAGW